MRHSELESGIVNPAIYNLGSVNIDLSYSIDHIVAPGETESAAGLTVSPGGKGFNQTIALARAGARVRHVGAVGGDGAHLVAMLREAGADVSSVATVSGPTGHAMIQVDRNGANSIVVLAGANAAIAPEAVRAALADASPGDILLCQNETSCVAEAIRAARARGMEIVLNPSPFDGKIAMLPLEFVDLFIVNEDEERALLALGGPGASAARIVTRGAAGCELVRPRRAPVACAAFRVEAVDTTAAGDTFAGYYVASCAAGMAERDALRRASAAAALSVMRRGAAVSVPDSNSVEDFLKQRP